MATILELERERELEREQERERELELEREQEREPGPLDGIILAVIPHDGRFSGTRRAIDPDSDGNNQQGTGAIGMSSINLDTVYVYHPPFGTQPERYVTLRDAAKQFARVITELTPTSREQSVALTNVQQAVMWANAAIAINERESV